MSRKPTTYARREKDWYPTPPWPIEALLAHVPLPRGVIWEPAAGDGAMVRVLEHHGYRVAASDIKPLAGGIQEQDFFAVPVLPPAVRAIITNPPYSDALAFALHALELLTGAGTPSVLALLLNAQWSSAKRNSRLVSRPDFDSEVRLTSRIQWLAGTAEDKGIGARENHSWYVWRLGRRPQGARILFADKGDKPGDVRQCPVCGTALPPDAVPQRRFCGLSCRVASHRARTQAA